VCPHPPTHHRRRRRHPAQQLQRQLKRQRSLAAGDLPALSELQAHQQPQQQQLQQQQSVFTPECAAKCRSVLQRVYAACATWQPIFGLPVKDVFYRPVHETFPTIAAEYYRVVAQPMTFAMIEERLQPGNYSTQQFADVSARVRVRVWGAVAQRSWAAHSIGELSHPTPCTHTHTRTHSASAGHAAGLQQLQAVQPYAAGPRAPRVHAPLRGV
jgi:hypothetical protein